MRVLVACEESQSQAVVRGYWISEGENAFEMTAKYALPKIDFKEGSEQ